MEEFVGSDPVWLATDADSMQQLIQNYRAQKQTYRTQMEAILGQLDQIWLAQTTLEEKRPSLNQLQQELLGLDQSASFVALEQLGQEVQRLIQQAQAQELLAEKEMEEAQGLEKLIIVLSALGSVAIAGFVAFRTTQAIVRPIQQVKETASNIIRDENFNLQIVVESDDDLGELAQSFNQLIQWIKEYTEELKQTLNNLKNTQSQLIQTEKMSSLGQLVAGVSHEINNPIGSISGNLTYLEKYLDNFSQIQQLYQKNYPNPPKEIADAIKTLDLDFFQKDYEQVIGSMRAGTQRIQNIVLSLRNFARLNESGLKPSDVHEGLDSTLMLLDHSLKAQPERPAITVSTHYGQLPKVHCYPGHLNQVFMSLLTNAIDAIAEVQSQFQRKHPHPNLPHSNQEENDNNPYHGHIRVITRILDSQWIEIEIADNGCGIPLEQQSQIFDPFFTTKPVGEGSGLGLFISYQIVTDLHKGQLHCDSTPGVGSQFTIRLPLQI
ncbi:MAG: ATP-binding protein [Leptolyngbyaceae bacterium]|nr:ATP-binding protein [Leptolyngbyaceae bacterium]